jgi:peptide/nickel transport system substrate-binding protein
MRCNRLQGQRNERRSSLRSVIHARSGIQKIGAVIGAVLLFITLALTSPLASAASAQGGSFAIGEPISDSTWTSLDPATDITCCDYDYKQAIYGGLFLRIGTKSGSTLWPDLATSYHYTNGNKTIVFNLRKGVKFTDGTPFNAAAVVSNWKRDLSTTCACKTSFLQTTPPVITQTGPYSVSLGLTYPDPSFITGLSDAQFNFIGSPTAEAKMGEQAFAAKPVGAGPFMVETNNPGTQLVLKRNPNYWQTGLPHLNTLTFKVLGSDETALEAMKAGTIQGAEYVVTTSLIPSFKSAGYTVTSEPVDSEMAVQFNTRVAPFNNIKAREAILYATDPAVLDQKLQGNLTPLTESFIEQGGLFFTSRNIPGTLHYDLAKAKALVKSLGGLSFTLMTQNLSNLNTLEQGLASQWTAAGMNVKLVSDDFPSLQQVYFAKQWQIALHYVGALDPATGVGPNLMMGPNLNGNYSGVEDPTLNKILVQASEVVNPAQRTKLYYQASKYIAKNVYGMFIYPVYGANVVDKDVKGPGLTTSVPAVTSKADILWQDVTVNN